jgi:hypothetical protein
MNLSQEQTKELNQPMSQKANKFKQAEQIKPIERPPHR